MSVLLKQPKAIGTLKQRARDAVSEICGWIDGGLRLEKPAGSALHRLDTAMLNYEVLSLSSGEDMGRREHKIVATFVVQHDWGAVFANAEEFDAGDYTLPFDHNCFEFKISGKRVCAMVNVFEDKKTLAIAVETKGGWVLPHDAFQLTDGVWSPYEEFLDVWDKQFGEFVSLLASQVRAVCISLEAQVAKTDVVEPSSKLNRSRVSTGKAPLAPYHVVSLNRNPQWSCGEARGPTARKRLHFRRGHWRHYDAERKTWISWMLVGNPDLGFIEKEYRL